MIKAKVTKDERGFHRYEETSEPNRDPDMRSCSGACGNPSNEHLHVSDGTAADGTAADSRRGQVAGLQANDGLASALLLLRDAQAVIQDREPIYDSAERHWQATAQAATAYLRRRGWTSPEAAEGPTGLVPEDWGMLMILDKIMRQANHAKRDNLLDVCGYAACAQRVIESKEPK